MVVLLAAAVTAIAVLGVRGDLEQGRRALQDGRRALSFGNLEQASASFAEAGERFVDAGTSGGLAGAARAIPILGRNLDVADGLSRAGVELAAAGSDLVAAVMELPDGLGSLAPRDGALPLDVLTGLDGEVAVAERRAVRALELLAATPTHGLLGPVWEARAEAERQVRSAAEALGATRLLLDGLPRFAGADGTRRYFFVAESPAELRGTGGIWGAWAIVTVRDGRFVFSSFAPIQTLPNLPAHVLPAPNPDYRRNYDQFGGAGFWLNMNMTPDFPSAARAVLAAYERVEGVTLDGVISSDPFALQELLEVTGPTTVPGLGVRVNADNVVRFTTNEAYARYAGESAIRKKVLGAVAKGAFEEFLGMAEHNVSRLRAVAQAAAGGHLKVYSTDPTFEEGLRRARADAGFGTDAAGPGDALAVIVNSSSGSKVDYYAYREVAYDVQLGGEGEAIATTEVQIRNDAPTSGEPGFVIKPLAEGAEPGDNLPLLTISCAASCDLLAAERDGRDIGMRVGSELGLPWYQDFFTIPGGETSSLRIQTKLDDVWSGDSSKGNYRLTFFNQTTVQPTTLRVAIHAPEGTNITWTSTPMEVDGGMAVWEGMPGPRHVLEVRFSAPLPLRIWRDLGRSLG